MGRLACNLSRIPMTEPASELHRCMWMEASEWVRAVGRQIGAHKASQRANVRAGDVAAGRACRWSCIGRRESQQWNMLPLNETGVSAQGEEISWERTWVNIAKKRPATALGRVQCHGEHAGQSCMYVCAHGGRSQSSARGGEPAGHNGQHTALESDRVLTESVRRLYARRAVCWLCRHRV